MKKPLRKVSYKSTHADSSEYGPCEHCGEECSEVVMLSRKELSVHPQIEGMRMLNFANVGVTFGHRCCMEKQADWFLNGVGHANQSV